MKLFRHGPKGAEQPGILVEGVHKDLAGQVPDFEGPNAGFDALDKISSIDLQTLPDVPKGARLGPCLATAPNIFCIGLNYRQHAAETGAKIPEQPVLFMKATSSINGPFDPIPMPADALQMDWEVELGLVIGKPCYRTSKSQALSHVAGYFTANDVSERNWQKIMGSGQWPKGKSSPGFCPLGPYLITADEVADPNALNLSCKRNGQSVQASNTSDMIFDVATLIADLSKYFELQTGDIVLTGTPEGVGLGMNPPTFLEAGDVIETEVETLGTMRNEIQAL